jgi:hypothetical protein
MGLTRGLTNVTYRKTRLYSQSNVLSGRVKFIRERREKFELIFGAATLAIFAGIFLRFSSDTCEQV